MFCKGAFNCSGKININDWQLNELSLFQQNELQHFFNPLIQNQSDSYNLNLFGFDLCGYTVVTELGHFVKCMESKLKELLRHEKLDKLTTVLDVDKDTKYFNLRKQVCEFLVELRDYIECLKQQCVSLDCISSKANDEFNDLIQSIYKFMKRLKYIPDAFFFYAMSNFGNKFNKPEYHLYHMHLDLRWLIITLVNVRKMPWLNLDYTENFENTILMVIHDLVYISLKTFTNITNEDYKTKTPFACTCVRELWLMIQLLTDDASNKSNSKTFWMYVNTVLDNLLSTNCDIKDAYKDNALLPNNKKKDLFSMWFIYHLNLLYSYDENGEYLGKPYSRAKPNILQVENILKFYVNNGGKDGSRDDLDEELRILILLVHNLCLEWKEFNLNIITLFWECFHRRFDQILLTQKVGLYNLSFEKLTPVNILFQIKNRIKPLLDLNNQTSYGMFLSLIGDFLKIKIEDQDIKCCNRLHSRIYTSFSKKKVEEYTENGLYNFICLFLTLATITDTVPVTSKMISLLPSIFDNDEIIMNKKYSLSWKAQLIVLLLYNENECSYEQIGSNFAEMLNKLCCNKHDISRSMMNAFIDVFQKIISESKNLDSYQHLFLSGWVDRYLLDCPVNRSSVLIKTLLNIFEKSNEISNNQSGSNLMIHALWNFVASRVRQIVITHIPTSDINLYQDLTKLGVYFTIDACRNPLTGKKYGHSAEKLFTHFTISLIIKEIRITQLYLTLILQNNIAVEYLKCKLDFHKNCVQAWLKCSILINDNTSKESKFLVKYIQNLTDINKIVSPIKMNILESDEPVVDFLTVLYHKRLSLRLESDKNIFDTKCKQYFHNIEKWILSTVAYENKDSKSSIWIYKCAGTIVHKCSSIFYNKNQPNNLFHVLINKIALPTEDNQKFLENLGEKIFLKLILGFENLDFKTDTYSKTIFKQLFERYLPRLINKDLKKVSSQLELIFKDANESFIDYIFETLAMNFLTISGNKSIHIISQLAMFLLQHLLEKGLYYPKYVCKLIVSKCLTQILNCYFQVHDQHAHKKETINLIKCVSKNPYSRDIIIRESLNRQVWNTFSKYLSMTCQPSFSLARNLLIEDAELYNFIYDQLKIKFESTQNSNIKFLIECLKKEEKI